MFGFAPFLVFNCYENIEKYFRCVSFLVKRYTKVNLVLYIYKNIFRLIDGCVCENMERCFLVYILLSIVFVLDVLKRVMFAKCKKKRFEISVFQKMGVN